MKEFNVLVNNNILLTGPPGTQISDFCSEENPYPKNALTRISLVKDAYGKQTQKSTDL